jgi:hypothetical protein
MAKIKIRDLIYHMGSAMIMPTVNGRGARCGHAHFL